MILFTFLFSLAIALPAEAQQLSKDEQKEWKKKAKDYRRNPAALKRLTEERDQYREEAQDLQQRMNSVQAEMNQAQTEADALRQQIASLNNQLMAEQQTNRNLMQQLQEQQQPSPQPYPVDQGEEDYNVGTVYRIQVGAFKEVPAKFNQYPDMYVEESGGLKKVLLGQYRNYEDAKVRLSRLKSEGYSSAWVVPYIDGQRSSLREALRN